jgi:hypothetical protein
MAVHAILVEDVRLNRIEVRLERPDDAAAAYEPVARAARRERAADDGTEIAHRCAPQLDRSHVFFPL